AARRYPARPHHRFHLELTIHRGNADGALHVISDGSTVWEDVSIGKGEHFVSKWDLGKVQQTFTTQGASPQFIEQFYRSRAFAGVLPLLQNIRSQMTFHKQPEEAEWQKHKVFKLSAVWSA